MACGVTSDNKGGRVHEMMARVVAREAAAIVVDAIVVVHTLLLLFSFRFCVFWFYVLSLV